MRAATVGHLGTAVTVAVCLLAAACSATETDEAAPPATLTTGASTTSTTAAESTTSTTIVPADDDLHGSIDMILVNLGRERIDAFGGVVCAEEVVLLLLAIDRYETNTGHTADEFADVETAVGGPLEQWSWEGGEADPEPLPGSGCSSAGFDPIEQDTTSVCSIERRTFETAVETFRALDPSADPPTEDDLVGSFLQEPSERWDLDGWVVVPAPGSICEPT